MNLMQTLRDHKVAFGLLGGGGLILILLLLRSGSSSATASNPVSDVLGYNEQENELQAQESTANSQTAAQEDAVDQQYQAQDYQTAQAASAQNEETDASLIANLYDTQQGSQVDEAQLGDETSVENTENNDELSATADEYNSDDYQDQLTAQLYSQGITSQQQVSDAEIGYDTDALGDQEANDKQILNEVGSAGLNHGTQSLEDSLVGVLSGVEGDSSTVGTAAENQIGNGDVASAYENSSIFSSIAGLGKTVISGVL